ncbi:MAG TPA: hypothetical protein VFB68_09970, partial [Xanthobacteraceae bacterium]|nr:hypothetical protein [Xanthobacteraceae bacterium]
MGQYFSTRRGFLRAGAAAAALTTATLTCGAADADPALIKARQKFFGIENVDEKGNVKKDKVIFSWATNTTYVVSVQGRVMMLDTYLLHAELPTAGPIDRRRTKALPQDFVDLRPE